MLDPVLLRGQLEDVARRLATRGFELDSAAIEALEARRKAVQVETQELQNTRNTRSKAIGMAKAKGEDTAALMAEVASIADRLKANEATLADVQQKLADISLSLPNLPDASVPVGGDESGNAEMHRWGTPRTFGFAVKDHVELGERKAGWMAKWPPSCPVHALPCCAASLRACIVRWPSSCWICTAASTPMWKPMCR